MPATGPHTVEWTAHALAKAQLLGVARTDVEDAVLAGHDRRSRNTGAADWLVSFGRIAVAYNYPANDESTALVVTLWRRR